MLVYREFLDNEVCKPTNYRTVTTAIQNANIISLLQNSLYLCIYPQCPIITLLLSKIILKNHTQYSTNFCKEI